MDDDFEIEITDLNTGAAIRHSLTNHTPNDDPDEPDEPDHNDDGQRRLRATTPEQRRLRAAIVSGVLLLAVVLVFVFNPAAQQSLATVLHVPTPAPTETPLPGGDMVFLTRGAPWSVIAVDGKTVPFMNSGVTAPVVMLTHGHHKLVVTQPPFPTLRCSISSPVFKSDSCPLLSPNDNGLPQYTDGQDAPFGSRFVDLGARFSRLPDDAKNLLTSLIDATLQTQDTPIAVQVGDHYRLDDGNVAVAQTALQATFLASVLAPTDSTSSDSPSCVSFCDMTGNGNSFGDDTWDMMVALVGSWRVTTPSGIVIAQHAPMFTNTPEYGGAAGQSLQMMINLTWAGSWQLNGQDLYNSGWSSPVCQAAQIMLSNDLANTNTEITGMGVQNGPQPEWGCALSVTLDNPATSAPLYVYYHFGVLLAVNAAAEKAFPSFPLASASERATAQQLIATINQ